MVGTVHRHDDSEIMNMNFKTVLPKRAKASVVSFSTSKQYLFIFNPVKPQGAIFNMTGTKQDLE